MEGAVGATTSATIDELGFPDPPHRIWQSRPRAALLVGYLAVGFLFLIGAGLLLGYFGLDRTGRTILVDTALALGLGRSLPEAEVRLGECVYKGTRAGSRLPGFWRCPVTVSTGAERIDLTVEQSSKLEGTSPRGAGRIVGQVGVYWPPGVLLARWWSTAILLMTGFGLIGLSVMFLRWSSGAWRLARVRRGKACVVDLLTCEGRPGFAFLDAAGRRRFDRAQRNTKPLILDSLMTSGVALVSGRTAVLLDLGLLPLELDGPPRADVLARIAAVQHRSRIRPLLAPQPGDPPSLQGRIDRIERGLSDRPDAAGLGRLYDEAWRLIWDGNDADIARRAIAAREEIARRLGPAATLEALLACRRRYA